MTESSGGPLPTLAYAIRDFIMDRKVRRVSPRTIEWHTHYLSKWSLFCAASSCAQITAVSPRLLCQFVAQLEDAGHNPGGVFSIYRSVRTFLLWCEDEYEPPGHS